MDFKLPVVALSFFNFCLYGTRAILSGYILNAIYEETNSQNKMTVVTEEFLFLTLISCMLGAGASMFGFVHFKEWTDTSRMIAMALGIMAMNMDLLVTGYASKQWELDTNKDGEDLEGRLHFMGIATVVEAFTMMLFVGVLFMPIQKKEDEGEMTDEHQHDDEQVEKNSA